LLQIEIKMKIFLVDDDALFLKLLEIEFLQYPEFTIETYPTGELCMENISHNPDIIVLDYHLDGLSKGVMNGIQTLQKIKDFNPDIQVVILSQQDVIDIAIDAIQHNAIDYVVKSDTAFARIQNIIFRILNYKNMAKGLNWYLGKATSAASGE
jgi:two-component system OmpR family response regulator